MQAIAAGPAPAPRRQVIVGASIACATMLMLAGGMMAVWSWLIGSKMGRGLAMAGGVIIAILTLRWKWTRDGAKNERRKAQERDRKHAGQIRNRVDDVRPADSVRDVDDRIFRD